MYVGGYEASPDPATWPPRPRPGSDASRSGSRRGSTGSLGGAQCAPGHPTPGSIARCAGASLSWTWGASGAPVSNPPGPIGQREAPRAAPLYLFEERPDELLGPLEP